MTALAAVSCWLLLGEHGASDRGRLRPQVRPRRRHRRSDRVRRRKFWVAPTNALDFGLGFYGYGVNNRCFTTTTEPAHRTATTTAPSTWTTSGSRTSSAVRLSSTGTSAPAGARSGRATATNDCFAIGGARAARPRPDVQQPRAFSRSSSRCARPSCIVPGIWLRDRRRPRRPLLLLDRGTSLAPLALVPRAPGSLRAGKATLRSLIRRRPRVGVRRRRATRLLRRSRARWRRSRRWTSPGIGETAFGMLPSSSARIGSGVA